MRPYLETKKHKGMSILEALSRRASDIINPPQNLKSFGRVHSSSRGRFGLHVQVTITHVCAGREEW